MSFVRTMFQSFAPLRSERRVVALLLLGNVGLAVALFVEPVLFGGIVDRLTRGTADRSPLGLGTTGLVVSWITVGLVSIGCSVLVALHADRMVHRARLAVIIDFFAHALSLPQTFHLGTHSARLVQVMNEGTGALSVLWLPFFRDQCTALVMLGITLPLSIALNWRLGLVMALAACLFGLSTLIVLRRTQSLQGEAESHHAAIFEVTADVLGNLPMIQSFTRAGSEIANVRRLAGDLLRVQMPVLNWWALAAVATRVSSTVTLIAVLVLGLRLKTEGLASVGDIVTFMALAALVTARLSQIVSFANQLLLNTPKLRDLFAVFAQRSTIRDNDRARDPGRLEGYVSFEGVGFSYDGVHEAVADVSFTAAPGELVALVGATGSGKSTTLSLLHRIFDPIRGRITIDGTDLRDLPLGSLRRNVAVVFQDPMLLRRSIVDNLRVGDPEATDDALDRALARAQAARFVAAQPNGRDTVLGQGGRTLSGGERQRLSVARALVKDAPILILDEATSALDPATERDVHAAIEAVKAERTVFVIAHRLSTVRNADRILVFSHGRLVESGTYADLLERDAVFTRLMNTGSLGLQREPA